MQHLEWCLAHIRESKRYATFERTMSVSESHSSCFHACISFYTCLIITVLIQAEISSSRTGLRLFFQSILQDQQSPEIIGLILPGPWKYMNGQTEIACVVFLTGSKTKTMTDLFLSEWSLLTHSCTIAEALNMCRNLPEKGQESTRIWRHLL